MVPDNNDEGFSSDDEEDIAWQKSRLESGIVSDIKISPSLTGTPFTASAYMRNVLNFTILFQETSKDPVLYRLGRFEAIIDPNSPLRQTSAFLEAWFRLPNFVHKMAPSINSQRGHIEEYVDLEIRDFGE